MLRKYFTYIIKSDLEDYPENNCIIDAKRNAIIINKGERRPMTLTNVETGEERTVEEIIGLGHADFKDEEDYQNRCLEVIHKKMFEVGIGDLIEEDWVVE
jgi:hypothetical protein